MVVIVRAVEEVLGVDTVDKGRPTPTRGANDPRRREERTDQGVMVFTNNSNYFFSQVVRRIFLLLLLFSML